MRQSLAICTYGLQLAAASLGLGSAWGTLQGGPGEVEIRDLLHIPAGYTIDHIVPLGYADVNEGSRASALRAARERGPRRRPLKGIVHWEGFEADKARSDEQVEEFIWAETVTRVERR